jgi:hypothetical protein
MLVFSKEQGCVALENAFLWDKGVDLTREKNHFLKEHKLLLIFLKKHNHVPKGTQAIFWEHNCSCSRVKNSPSKHNDFLGNMVTLSWRTWFVVFLWVQPWSLGNAQFFWEWLSSLRWKLSKTNIKMIKRFELKISNLERERERERVDSINTIFYININVLGHCYHKDHTWGQESLLLFSVVTPYDLVFGWTSHPMADLVFWGFRSFLQRGGRGGNQHGTSIKLAPLSLFIPFTHGFASILLFEACPLYRFKV